MTTQDGNSFDWDLINDLSALPENEDIIVDFLLDRLRRGKIYTWLGSLLLVLNPCGEATTTDIYGSTEFQKYLDVSATTRKELSPHIYAVAAKAHCSLTQKLGHDRQVIVISGETGTGKTFNAFKCLEFLSSVNNRSKTNGESYALNIMQRITDACRLISVFTTACTERNEVSSRHGQLVKLHYEDRGISGATIDSFLLERTRITKGSNNFQIFYQMMFGMSEGELEALDLSPRKDYFILSTVDVSKRKYFEESFRETLKALEIIGFEVQQIREIFKVLALLIHMGNIKFVEDGETCTIDLEDANSREALENTCALGTLSQEDVTQLLTTILINPRSTWRKHASCFRSLVTVDACRNRMHSIIRHVYDLLFRWILERTNKALSSEHECSEWLGVLDIFGFECFDTNGIEQLCVNYANEKMQRYFMETYLENSRKDLQEEGFIDKNRTLDTLDLYKERLCVLEEALFLTLNDACQSAITLDTCTVVRLACKNSHNARRRFLRERGGYFIVEHYSGPVAYSIKDLLSKNTDKVPMEISTTFNSSGNKFLRTLVGVQDHESCAKGSKKRTMLAKLKSSMEALVKELNKCDLYYVRCVKPSRSDDQRWNRKDFKKQLACTGVFDALPLAKCKFPIRLSYQDFCRRYSGRSKGKQDTETCKEILESIVSKEDSKKSVHFGKRLIFLTESVFLELEQSRRNYRRHCVNKIQTFWLSYRRRKASELRGNESSKEKESSDVSTEDSKEFCGLDEDAFVATSTKENSPEKNLPHLVGRSFFRKKVEVPKKPQNYLRRLRNRCVDTVMDWFKNVTRFSNDEGAKFSMSSCYKRADKDDVDVNCNNLENLSIRETLLDGTSKKKLKDTRHGGKYTVHYDEEKRLYTVELGGCTLFYKNRILSRRRLTEISQDLPRGLQDCL